MNRIDVEKKTFDDVTAQKSKINLLSPHGVPVKHKNKGTDVLYPEEQIKTSSCKECK
jgi:protoheme ferro-lyase